MTIEHRTSRGPEDRVANVSRYLDDRLQGLLKSTQIDNQISAPMGSSDSGYAVKPMTKPIGQILKSVGPPTLGMHDLDDAAAPRRISQVREPGAMQPRYRIDMKEVIDLFR